MKKEITTVANSAKKDNIIIIDIYGEQFNKVVKNHGGAVITAKELFECLDEIIFNYTQASDRESYYEIFDIIVGFLKELGTGSITPYQQSILDVVLDDMRKSNESNTISNLVQRLQKKDNMMASILEILNNFPNSENNKNIINKLNNRFICFDLGNCQKDFKSLAYLLALKLSKDKIWKNGEKQIYTYLFAQIDYAILSEGICNYLLCLYKRMRQHWGISSLYTIKFSTFTNNHILTGLLNNTNEFICLMQDYDDINKLSFCFNIPDTYLHFLKYADVGQGIWTDGIQFDFVDYNKDFLLDKERLSI